LSQSSTRQIGKVDAAMEKTSHSTIKEIRHSYQKSLDMIDIDILLAHATGQSREFLLAHPDYTLADTEYTQAIGYLERRINHEPIAYILGKKEFYGLDFIVNQYTLIPRPETELLIDETLKILSVKCTEKNSPSPLIIDIGTGSGNIIITLATLLHKKNITANLFGLDISPDALEIAKKNAQQHGVGNQITFLQSDLLEKFFTSKKIQPGSPIKSGMTIQEYEYTQILILANLPYLSQDIYQSAELDVKDYEPITALVSDEAGLTHYRRLLEQIDALCQKNIFSSRSITLILEISPEQKPLIEALISTIFPDARIAFIQDYSQRTRFVKIEL